MIGRILLILLLSFVGLVGLGMSLCGGVFTFTGLLDPSPRGGEFHSADFLPISVPSLVVGLGIVYGVVRGLRRMARKAAARAGESPSDEAGGAR
jgi:hypothetical protein